MQHNLIEQPDIVVTPRRRRMLRQIRDGVVKAWQALGPLPFADAVTERAFREDYRLRALRPMRLALLLGLVLYLAFGVTDSAIFTEHLGLVRLVRYGLMIPCLAFTLVFSYTSYFVRYLELIVLLVGVTSGISISWIMSLAHGPALYIYFGCLLLTISIFYTYARVTFGYAVTISAINSCVCLGMLLSGEITPVVMVMHVLLLIAFNIVGMSACYTIERSTRSDFLRRRDLQRQAEQLQMMLTEVNTRHQQAELLARTDALTGLFNRRYFTESIQAIYERAQLQRQPVSVIVLDIDHFKAVNDTYGHQVGDTVIRQVADQIRASLRRTDLAARYGGEEFALILPDTSPEEAYQTGERLRVRIEALAIATPRGVLHATASLGVATVHPTATMPVDDLVLFADRALYQAKNNGRNQVCCYDQVVSV